MSQDSVHSIFDQKFALNYTQEDIENIFKEKDAFKVDISDSDYDKFKEAFNDSHTHTFETHQDYMKFMNKYSRNRFSKPAVLKIYRKLIQNNSIQRNPQIEKFMKLKATKGNSGILQITTMMSGQLFGDDNNIKNGGCPHKCKFCPLEIIDGVITQPHSYLTKEPANQRATQNKHHPLGQIWDRLNVLEKMGHLSPMPDVPAKIEYMISGGTFNFFPYDYIEWFTTMSYYAMNIYYDYIMTGKMREMLSLEEEQRLNETSPIRMIGLTIETRPDYLTTKNDIYSVVRFFRRLGVTRVQVGVQHTDDEILKGVSRDCTDAENQEGIKILMQNGFKVDIHLMTALPGATPEKDIKMINEIFTNPNFAVDQMKLYPTTVTEFSEIYNMYQRGEYVPYYELENGKYMQEVIEIFLKLVPYHVRVNRIVRDFFSDAIVSGLSGDMRRVAEESVQSKGIILKDIRSREVGDNSFDQDDCFMFIDKYDACDGIEYFISFENHNRTKLYGFTRLRLNMSTQYTMPELINCAMIRELHVYGQHTGVGDKEKNKTQHRGLGKQLIAKAEEIAAFNGFDKIIVISGVGVRNYYRKLGYSDYHTYLIKDIDLPMKYHYVSFGFACLILLSAIILLQLFF
jgi:elongator complex protein 3